MSIERIPGRKNMAFDLEGTLVDLEKFHQLAFQQVAEGLGLSFGPKEFRNFVGAGDEAISKAIAHMGSLSRVQLDPQVIRKAKMSVYHDMLHSHPIQAREGVGEYLESAKLIGGDLIIASVTPEEDAHRILKEAHLLPFFTFVLTESDVPSDRKKPHPDVYIKAAEVLVTENKEMIVHEDSPTGVTAGKAAGSPVAAFPVHDGLTFNTKPDAVYLSWKGLTPEEVTETLFKQ